MSLSLSSLGAGGRLDLSGRKLDHMPVDVASFAPALFTLDLSANNLGDGFKLPPLPLLVELRLADNMLGPAAVQRAAPLPATLHVLDLSANRLSILPPCILRLPQLVVLNLDRQRLRALPEELCMLTQLVELNAGFNELQKALPLRAPGLPRLRRLVLRSNGLVAEAIRLDANALPSLTELDLAGNLLAAWPTDVGKLESLRSLNLANNRLGSLVSSATVPHKRMWVPSDGVHTLSQLAELSVAQNCLTELPAGINMLRALRRLDVRCNPLSSQSTALATAHCQHIGARLLASAIARAGPGLLLGDESSAWHRPTLLRMHVRSILSVGASPPDGVPASRLAAKMPEEFALVMGAPAAAAAPAAVAAPAAAAASPAAAPPASASVVTMESLRRAFHASALRLHPDKHPEAQRESAAAAFASLQDAYRALGRTVAMERRRLPELNGFTYAFVELPTEAAAAEEHAKAKAEAEADVEGETGVARSRGEGSGGVHAPAATDEARDEPTVRGDATADATAAPTPLAAAFRAQLPAALEFAREVRRAASGELLLHPAGGASASTLSLAVLLAILIDADAGSLSVSAAMRGLASALGWEALPTIPPPVVAELEAFAKQSLRSRLHVTRVADAAVGVTSSDAAVAATARTSAAAATAAATAATTAAATTTSTGSGGNGDGYSPQLSVEDPFGMEDPFGGLSIEDPFGDGGGFGGLSVEDPFGGDFSIGGGGGAGAAGGVDVSDVGAPAEEGRTSDIFFTTATATPSAGTDTLSIGGEPEEAGWHVDEEGRNVLSMPNGRRVTRVVVEYAEGARRGTGGGEGGSHSFAC